MAHGWKLTALLSILSTISSVAPTPVPQGFLSVPYVIQGYKVLIDELADGTLRCTVNDKYVMSDVNECPMQSNGFWGMQSWRQRVQTAIRNADSQAAPAPTTTTKKPAATTTTAAPKKKTKN